jgi:hypothetical protein
LALEIFLVLNVQRVFRSLLLDLTCGFDGVVSVAAVFAFERFEDNVAKERYSEEEKSGDTLKFC